MDINKIRTIEWVAERLAPIKIGTIRKKIQRGVIPHFFLFNGPKGHKGLRFYEPDVEGWLLKQRQGGVLICRQDTPVRARLPRGCK